MVASPIAPESSLDAVATVYYCDTQVDAMVGASGVLPNGCQGASYGTAEYGSLRLIVAPQPMSHRGEEQRRAKSDDKTLL